MQQINLYLKEFRQIEPELSASIIVILNGYVLIFGVLIFGMVLLLNQYESKQQQVIEQQALYWQEQLVDAMQKYPEPQIDQSIIKQIEKREQDEKKNKYILKYLKEKEIEHLDVKFSELVEGLTRVSSMDTWLTRLMIEDSGKRLILKGLALHTDAVPEYIHKLSSIDSFKFQEFDRIEVRREGDYVQFTIGSDHKEVFNGISLENAAIKN